jgi:phosphoribosylaminoimidazolecarboxamide formyltransferase/IMP cyclohydrolase
MKRRILISVTDKTGLEKFKVLTDLGWEIISTGGTATKLQEFGIPCILIQEITQFPEMMNGRLKTLHPNIFGGILADRDKEDHLKAIAEHHIELIDMVVVNLYDFEGKPGIENIDIGGPSLLRAAAKNGRHTIPVCDPEDYDYIIEEISRRGLKGNISLTAREELVIKTFKYTCDYDNDIYQWLQTQRARDKKIL